MHEQLVENIINFFESLQFTQYVFVTVFITTLYVTDRIAVKYLSKIIEKAFRRANRTIAENLINYTIVRRLAHLAPAIIVNSFIHTFEKLGFSLVIIEIIQKSTSIYIIAIVTSVIVAILNAIQGAYKKFRISSKLPIKNYIQIIKIIVIFISIILMISVILGKSPLAWLTSFGAIAAILSLAFKESIADIMAGIEIAVYDVIRIGDWITIPKFDVDGDITDITLTKVKVINFDKTETFVPTSAILSSGIKNWRGMFDSGGRRIKRSFTIDALDIKFVEPKELEEIISKIQSITEEFLEVINQLKQSKEIFTNEMLYRKYVYAYLNQHNQIHSNGFTLIVRHLEPNENGLPIQIYCFTTDTNWKNHEDIQSDIFSHLIATLHIFGLKTYQRSSDFKQ